MAFGTNSKIFTAFVTDSLNRTNAFDLNSDAPKVTLYGNSGTPDQTVAAASTAYNTGQWVTANEVTSGGWVAGGIVLGSVTSTFATNVYTFDAADTANSAGSPATLTTYGCLVYDDTLTTPVADQGICYLAFGGAQTVTAGVLTIVYNASGILTITV